MELFRSIGIGASALTAQRVRMDIISDNIANVHTTKSPDGQAYRRRVPVFAEYLTRTLNGERSLGVRVAEIRKDPSPFRYVFEPGHPDADARGYVAYPNVNVVKEMVDLMEAGRAYEANVTAINAAKDVFRSALGIGRG